MSVETNAQAAAMKAAGELPERAQVVVVGGGVIGCSVAYHLVGR